MAAEAKSRDKVLQWLVVDASAATPPYEQIRGGIAEAIHTGRLPAGTKLPAVRALAGRLSLAVNTVARAYRELEHAELVHTRSRAGTVVSPGTDEGRKRLTRAAAAYADVVRSQGATGAEAVALLKAALQREGYDA
ncbi:GntR family transcriptional regulator [Arthrobacter castelli]|uniref:GntR family transcriptional regulator n=1 Tax=Arthrobacter castelli TaxID=271431 RepID=UPI0004160E04|nr:GntR family transcriptional regulator [Arthrobacter castelli]